MMQKELSVIGNSMGIIFDKPILELLHIDKNTTLHMSTDGEALVIRPLRDDRRERARASAQRVASVHAGAFDKRAR